MKLIIYGASGLAKEIYDVVMRSYPGKYEKIYFIDDFALEGDFYLSERLKFTSLEKRGLLEEREALEGVVAIGEPVYRQELTEKLITAKINLATIIDNTALISPTADIAAGSIICEYSTIHANVKIGQGCLIQPYCDVGHDIVIGDYSVISSNAAPGGSSIFGKRVYVGMNATTIEKITIGDDVIIGMGAVVYKDLENGVTVIGNPARITKGNIAHKVFS